MPARHPASDVRPPASGTAPQTVEQVTARNIETIAELERTAQSQQSSADRVAGSISRFCGSIVFVWVHVVFFTGWILANTVLPITPFDKFPFSFLTLAVSLEAIFLSTFILISENREARINERRSHLDLQINLLAEQENTKMLQLLNKIAAQLGIQSSNDPAVSVLEQHTAPERVMAQIDESADKLENDAQK